ncbi:hypothetical protein ACU4HD_44640 (plasmid) [Cupriavidus basilensis]
MMATTKKQESSDHFLDSLTDELIAASDDQLLDGVDGEAAQRTGLDLLKKAKAEAGRRRLAAARERAAASRARGARDIQGQVSAESARAYLSKVANDPRYTMAARNLGEMSDDDVLRLYDQLRRLEDKNLPKGSSS